MCWIVSTTATRVSKRVRTASQIFLSALLFVGVWLEVPYHLQPELSHLPNSTLVIFGDSVTAGLGDDGIETWPKILNREESVIVADHSHVGETVASALKRIPDADISGGTVIIELGGNDLLDSTDVTDFERDLDEFLGIISQEAQQTVMFELPLPPFKNSFGKVQRELAAKHSVKLIPKRVLMGVLSSENSTLDSIHLSQSGQQN